MLRAARAYLYEAVQQIASTPHPPDESSDELLALVRLAGSYAAEAGAEIASMMFTAGGEQRGLCDKPAGAVLPRCKHDYPRRDGAAHEFRDGRPVLSRPRPENASVDGRAVLRPGDFGHHCVADATQEDEEPMQCETGTSHPWTSSGTN